jgi:hypothetical protein
MTKAILIVAIALLALASAMSAAAYIPADPALDKPITLAVKGEALSDVLTLIQQQTGVLIKASAGVADQKVTIFVGGKPLREVMEGLTKVFKYDWIAKAVNGKATYEVNGQSATDKLSAREQAIAAAWTELEATIAERAAFSVDPSQLKAELDRFRKISNDGAGKPYPGTVYFERLQIEANKRDTPIGAAALGDIVVSRLYQRLSGEAKAALKAGNMVRFDTQSSDPAWLIPGDVRPYIDAVVKIQECELTQQSRKPGDGWLPDWDNYAVTLLQDVGGDRLILGWIVNARRESTDENGSSDVYKNSMQQEIQKDAPMPPQGNPWGLGQDLGRNQEITVTWEEIGKEAHSTAFGVNSEYDATASDVLSLLHAKAGLQIISDHYTSYYTATRCLAGKHFVRDALRSINSGHGWRSDGTYLYVRTLDPWTADSQETPNRILRPLQAVYAKQGYLGLDELARIHQLGRPRIGPLQRFGALLGLESIDWFGGWIRVEEYPYLKLYGALTAEQKVQVLGKGLPVAEFSAKQKQILKDILGENSGYEMAAWASSPPGRKTVVGIYDKAWRRLGGAAETAPAGAPQQQAFSSSEPLSVTVRQKPGETSYYWFHDIPSRGFYGPDQIWGVTSETEALKQIQSKSPKATLANVKLMKSIDYEFVVKFADGKLLTTVVRVPLAPVSFAEGKAQASSH